ncbi:MAG: hypothetical protein LUE89_07690, partial [Clostridiales bacterium]|nr:hypothetical protein [Clostridiales bacterium]
MKKQRTKRLAALVLALAMTLSTLSLPVYAADISEAVSDAADTLLTAETEEAETPSAEDADETGDESVAEESIEYAENVEAIASESTETADSETAEAEQIVTAAETLTPPATDKVGLEEESGWYYGSGWEWQYSGADNSSVTQENGMVKATVDFSADSGYSYSKMAISYYSDGGVSLDGVNQITLDFYYDEANMTSGSFQMTFYSDVLQIGETAVDMSAAETVEDTLKKVSVTLTGDSASGSVNGITFCLIGVNTDYQGDLWLDNVQFAQADTEEDDGYVDSTETTNTQTSLSGSSSALTVNGTSYAYATEVQLADPDADDSVLALYQYLKAVGESDSALYGHMEDTVLKAGSSSLSYSDTQDLTGSLSAIDGYDCGDLFAGYAAKYNARHPDEEQLPETTEGNIKAAALLSNESIKSGAIMTLSCHMPNFSYAMETDPDAEKTYDRYDYSEADSYTLTGDTMNEILPGGAYNAQFTAFLDLVAEYAQQVDGAILFRPFHENTGSWFWWGKAFCDAETYKSVYKYTVEYLRDEKGVHNLLYVYGPGSEAATVEEYGERYPGDAYVDIVGFDSYDDQATDGDSYTFQKNFEAVVAVTDQFAKEHNKLFAVTETGISNSAMKKTGNERLEWFTEILDIITKDDYNCVYYMVWSNYSSNGNYYSPFAVSVNEDGTLHGHEMMDPFIRFYNNAKSIFATDQQAVICGETQPATPNVGNWDITGYFTAPVAGTRILEATTVTARVSQADTDAVITVSNGTNVIALDTSVNGKTVSAELTAEALAQLGETASGAICLCLGEEQLAEIGVIFNIEETEADPYLVDDFESYYGVDSLLTSTWATNKASGSTISLTLTDADGEAQEGFGLNFTYSETSGGWAGATISKEVDWSDCNALQFWTIPDANQQKVVIQIQANDTCYEAYLNLYEDYAALAGQPTLVTIPFSEFCQRDTEGNPTGGLVNDCSSVTSFGLWVNAIDNEYFDGDTVSGSIWYDNITAVSTDLTEATFTALTEEETVDTSSLTAAIEQAEALTESDYTADSWSALQTALESAKTVAANADATQTEVDEAASALSAAIDALAAAEKVTV